VSTKTYLLCILHSTRREHTPPTRVISTQSDPGFGSGFSKWSGSGCPPSPDRSQKVVNGLACRRLSFRRVSWNGPVTVWEMLTNLLTSSILQWWRTWKSDPESVSGIGSLSEANRFFRLVGPIVSSSFNEIKWLLSADRQTNRQTNSIDYITSSHYRWQR